MKSDVLKAIDKERSRQDERHGNQSHNDHVWLSLLTEELGELAKAINESHFYPKVDMWRPRLKELLRVAAVSVSWLELFSPIEIEEKGDEQEKTNNHSIRGSRHRQ